MPTILCYGDSNTWGQVPGPDPGRYDPAERWPGVMRAALGNGYRIIEEGLPGRTTVLDDPIEGAYKNGLTYLTPCLESHTPLDLVIVMLGTNDLKMRFNLPACDIAQGAGLLVHTIQRGIYGVIPDVLLVCPPPVKDSTIFDRTFAGAIDKSRRMADHYRRIAGELACHFFDAGEVIVSSGVDGIHFDRDQHHKLGLALAGRVRDLLQT